MAWTTADLLTAIKNDQMFPDASSGSLSSAALLDFATRQLYLTVVPMILGVREKYYETYVDYAYSTSTATITLPARSIGGTVSCVQYIQGYFVRNLTPIDPSTVNTIQTSAQPTNYYFQNNSIVFYPAPSGGQGTVRIRYFQRPNRLEQTSNCAQITAFNSGTGVVTCVPPITWTTSNIFDFAPQTAAQATPYGLNSTISAISSSSITFTTLPSAVAVGDWIALAEYTPVPEIPFEFQEVLAQATSLKGLKAINDQIAIATAKPELDVAMALATKMIAPRDQSGGKIVISGWRRF